MPADSRPRLVNLNRRTVNVRALVRIGIVAGTALLSVLAVTYFGRPYDFFDMKIYHGAVVWWTDGGDLYRYAAENIGLGFTYPPFAALAMLPMALFSAGAAGWINIIASVIALSFIMYWLLASIADRNGWSRRYLVAIAVPLAVATEPIRETLGYGQVNILLAMLIFADLYALRRGARWAGVGVGLAAAVKLTPGLFVVYFAVTRQWRAALTSLGTTAGVTIGTFMLAGNESWQYFTTVLWQTERVGNANATPNQSLAGLLARLYDQPDAPGLLWFAFALLVLAVGLTRAMTAHQEGDEVTAFTLVGLTTNAVSPISWTHHLVFLVPAVVILGDVALHRRSVRHALAGLGLYALIVSSLVWDFEHKDVSHYTDGVSGMFAENALAIAILALVAVLPWRPGAEPVYGQLTHSSVPSSKTWRFQTGNRDLTSSTSR